MSTNKSYYQEAMRGHDRALSNLENIPQGFQHLVQMQKTMKDAEGARSRSMPTKTSITGSEPSREITKEPFPNPWNSKVASSLRRATPLFPDIDEHLARPEELARFLKESQKDLRPEDLDLPTDSEPDIEDGLEVLEYPPMPDMAHYAPRFHKQLAVMKELGFTDVNENIRALLKTGGNMEAAIEWLMSRKNL